MFFPSENLRIILVTYAFFINSLFKITNENNSSLILVKVSLLAGVFLDFIGSKITILTSTLK